MWDEWMGGYQSNWDSRCAGVLYWGRWDGKWEEVALSCTSRVDGSISAGLSNTIQGPPSLHIRSALHSLAIRVALRRGERGDRVDAGGRRRRRAASVELLRIDEPLLCCSRLLPQLLHQRRRV